MSALRLEIPEELAGTLGDTKEEAVRNARMESAIQMDREAKCATGRAAEFAGLRLLEFRDLLRDRKVEKPSTIEMVEQDFAYARRRQ